MNTINTALVTGIWDLGRDSLSEGWGRSFDHYLAKFEELLSNLEGIPLIVFIDPQHEYLVWKHRKQEDTRVYHYPKEVFGGSFFPFFDQVQEIRTKPEWMNQVSWLPESTQAKLEWYNPMVMSKMFMLHNAKCFNPFDSKYLFWIDGGITNTVHPGYFMKDRVIEKIEDITRKMLFICFPYETTTEIHGFDIIKMQEMAGTKEVNRVARGGFFGGDVEYISRANDLYYSLLQTSLSSGYMGTEESIFTLMTYIDPDVYRHEDILGDGLISTFFENMKNQKSLIYLNTEESQTQISPVVENIPRYSNKETVLYINTFNAPEQLSMLLNSFEQYDKNFLNKTKKILINNSNNAQLEGSYDEICKNYDFVEQIKQGNMGICRARQFAAESFAQTQSRYMLFFEDDMLLDLSEEKCPFGLQKNVKDIFENLINIMNEEEFDFLKLSFSEFFGHNGEQWSWHNVPQSNRTLYFGDVNHRPPTNFNHIKTSRGVPYCNGEVYYSNWPHIIGQIGNQKLFLNTKWDSPYEQTWMSHIYTLTRNKQINPAILLASPITHTRKYFYEAKERREN